MICRIASFVEIATNEDVRWIEAFEPILVLVPGTKTPEDFDDRNLLESSRRIHCS